MINQSYTTANWAESLFCIVGGRAAKAEAKVYTAQVRPQRMLKKPLLDKGRFIQIVMGKESNLNPKYM